MSPTNPPESLHREPGGEAPGPTPPQKVVPNHPKIIMYGRGWREPDLDPWERVDRLQEALNLDPIDVEAMVAMGELHLAVFDQPRIAEKFFRQALAVDPSHQDLPLLLRKCIWRRSFLYRTLRLPRTTLRLALNRVERRNLTFYLIFFSIPLSIFLVWLLVAGAFFTPAAKLFEYMVPAEIPETKPTPRLKRWRDALLILLRKIICCGISICAWTEILVGVSPLDWPEGLNWVIFTFVAHYTLVCLLAGVQRESNSLERSRHEQRKIHPAMPYQRINRERT